MPTAFAPSFRRRLIAVMALWLVVLQSFLSGVATAQAGAAMADPLAAAVICHSGGGGGDPAGPALPDAGATWHLCCSYCVSAAAALLPPSLQIGRRDTGVVAVILPLAEFSIVLAREAVRAGPSQAPPGWA